MVAYEGTLRISLRKDGAGLPPQGRTVRAGAALPPGGARLLSPVVSCARDECRCCGCCGCVPGFLLSLCHLSMKTHASCRPSPQFSADLEAAVRHRPGRPGRGVCAGPEGEWDRLGQPGNEGTRVSRAAIRLLLIVADLILKVMEVSRPPRRGRVRVRRDAPGSGEA